MLEAIGSMDRVASAVRATIAAVMAERGLDPVELAAEAKLSDTLGLKSMDLAQIVLTLEDELETDPFQAIPITSIRTVGDLVTAYGVSLGLIDAAAPGAQDMGAEMAAARQRRAGRRR
ncbi:MAG TPA: acyl carrier protein [Thermohalobaculum sp.]|nr:acyl carrier protein [Thermohalobaculum sp.]